MRIHRSLLDVNGVDLLVRDTRTDGPAMLCLHGRWGRGETWVELLRRYGDRYRVIAPDQRGHGLSARPASAYTAEELAEDMVGLLDRLGLASAVVVGHSMGGRVAGYLAALHPDRVRGLAILDKSAAAPGRAGDEDASVDPLTRDWPMPFPSRLDAREFLRGTMESELSVEYFLDSLEETPAGYGMLFSAQAMAANVAHEVEWFHLLPRIACPVLLVRAVGSGAVPDEDLARMRSLLGDCTTHDIPHPDHNVHLADRAAFNACFDAFLARLDRPQ